MEGGGGGDHLRGILETEEDTMLFGIEKTWNIYRYDLIMQNCTGADTGFRNGGGGGGPGNC